MKLRQAALGACMLAALVASPFILSASASATPAAVTGSSVWTFPVGTALCGVTADPGGNIYAIDQTTGLVNKFLGGSGRPQTLGTVPSDTSFQSLHYHDGFLYVTVWTTSKVLRLDLGNAAAGWSPFVTAGIEHPQDMAWDSAGNIYVTNYTGSAVISTAGPSGGTATDLGVRAVIKPEGLVIVGSTIYLVDNQTYGLFSVPLAGNQAATAITTLPTMQYPWYVAVNEVGDLYVDDLLHGIVVVPADHSTPYWLATTGVSFNVPSGIVWSNGNLFVGDSAPGTYSANLLNRFDVGGFTPTTTSTTAVVTTSSPATSTTEGASVGATSITSGSTPELAATGTNVVELGVVGGVLVMAGTLGWAVANRRRTSKAVEGFDTDY